MIFLRKIKVSAILLFLWMPTVLYAQPSFSTKNAKVSFFSSTPIEDIKAASDKGSAVFIIKTRDLAFQVPIKSFQFSKGLMQEHFNENYMESDKYPIARFRGKINQDIDLSKDGEYPVTASGLLFIHGVEKQRTLNGKIKVMGNKIVMLSNFDVACVDHNIRIPKLVITKVAEIINVNVNATLIQNN